MRTPSKILSIDEMPNLSKRLGASGSDRIRYAGQADPTPVKGAANIPNTVIESMQWVHSNDPTCPVGDLLCGAANLDCHQTRPLNTTRLYNILQSVEMINTREIQTMTGLNKRQAQKYVRAVKFILPFIKDHFSA